MNTRRSFLPLLHSLLSLHTVRSFLLRVPSWRIAIHSRKQTPNKVRSTAEERLPSFAAQQYDVTVFLSFEELHSYTILSVTYTNYQHVQTICTFPSWPLTPHVAMRAMIPSPIHVFPQLTNNPLGPRRTARLPTTSPPRCRSSRWRHATLILQPGRRRTRLLRRQPEPLPTRPAGPLRTATGPVRTPSRTIRVRRPADAVSAGTATSRWLLPGRQEG